jgi:hypothetical protein
MKLFFILLTGTIFSHAVADDQSCITKICNAVPKICNTACACFAQKCTACLSRFERQSDGTSSRVATQINRLTFSANEEILFTEMQTYSYYALSFSWFKKLSLATIIPTAISFAVQHYLGFDMLNTIFYSLIAGVAITTILVYAFKLYEPDGANLTNQSKVFLAFVALDEFKKTKTYCDLTENIDQNSFSKHLKENPDVIKNMQSIVDNNLKSIFHERCCFASITYPVWPLYRDINHALALKVLSLLQPYLLTMPNVAAIPDARNNSNGADDNINLTRNVRRVPVNPFDPFIDTLDRPLLRENGTR